MFIFKQCKNRNIQIVIKYVFNDKFLWNQHQEFYFDIHEIFQLMSTTIYIK